MATAAAHISSRQNPLVARYRSVANREEDGILLLDGAHLIDDAIVAGLEIQHAVVDVNEATRGEIARLLTSLRSNGVDAVTATAPVMDALSPVRSASAIVAIARQPSTH